MKITRLVLGSLLTTLFFACPEVPPADVLPPPPSVSSFTVSQSEVPVGTSVKLAWSVENATELKIDELKLGSLSGVSGNSGEVEVAIVGDSLFVLTARNARGVSDTAVVSVRVAGSTEADLLFTALPSTISAGEQVTLAWSAPGASTVTITATPGGDIALGGQITSGSVIVTPSASTSYTLTAGQRSATTAITVRPTLISFDASSLAVDAGSDVTLSWETSGATRVQLLAPGRAPLVDETDPARMAAGSFDDTLPAVVDRGRLFPYQLVVTGPGATITRDLVITISGAPAVLTFTGPTYAAQSGDAGITLKWTTREADALSLAADGAEIYRAPVGSIAAGEVKVPSPSADATYVLTATNSRGGTASRSVLVDVVARPTVNLVATPSSIALGDPVAVSWTGTDIRNVRITSGLGGAIFTASGQGLDTGSVPNPVSFAQASSVTIEVDNGVGQTSTATANISVSNPLQFSVPPGSIRAGEKVTVSWTPATTVVTGLPHDELLVRASSTGFDDISSSGASVTLPTGDAVAKIQPVGFRAPFFDRIVGDEAWLSIDGFMSFSPTGNWAYSAVPLPSSKLEAYSIAPCWYDTTATVRWQVKDLAVGKVLIVQWDTKFQVKVFSSGQIDIEYKTAPSSCTGRGVRGPRGDTGFPFTTTIVANQGLTLFGPKTGSAAIPFQHELPFVGSIELLGRNEGVRGLPGVVVRPNELSVSEAMVFPAPSLGANGQWFELFNSRSTAIDLTGWSLAATDGGVGGALSGVLAPHGVLVAGPSADPSLNGDAGVQLALTGFAPGLDAGIVAFGRGGNGPTFGWANQAPGTSVVNDFGPYKFSNDPASLAREQRCAPTTTFGGGQFGSPGAASDCGFPYVWQELAGGYFDISTTGTRATLADLDNAVVSVPLTGAPFTYFGTQQLTVSISTNGFVSFDGTNRDSRFPLLYPTETDVNAVLAIFAADVIGGSANSGVFYERVGANVDPAAAAPHWIIQWSHWSHFDTYNTTSLSDGKDDLNFQIKLFDDGTIEYHFGKMLSGGSLRLASGIRSLTWLENPSGTQALVINTRSLTPGISPNSAYRFTPR